jgi:CRISPR-associated protein Cmr6
MRHKKRKQKIEEKTKGELIWLIPAAKWIKENSQLIETSLKQGSIKVNRSLLFDKYLFWSFDKNENIRFKDDSGKTISIKEHNLNGMQKISIPLTQKEYIYLKDRKNSYPNSIKFILKTKTRLIVNHGGESVLESNTSLHPYYGFPVIPGSAIKGVTRHHCNEYKNMDKKKIIEIFGNEPAKSPAKEGRVVFLDAWPATYVNLNSLELDVMTPHYKDYHSGQSFPSDTINPEPHLFLSVKKGICFEFSICASSSFKGDENKLLNEAKSLIIDTLSTFGIGAKTGSNYGYFE